MSLVDKNGMVLVFGELGDKHMMGRLRVYDGL
jgi:hypothetical protein